MSNTLRRLFVAAVVTLCGTSVASAQAPGLRPVTTNQTGVRSVTTVSPVPGMFMQQELAWQNAYRQARLWQMYQPPVVVVNPVYTNPWAPTFPVVSTNPWGPTITSNPWGPTITRNPWGPTITPATNWWTTGKGFYRTYNSRW